MFDKAVQLCDDQRMTTTNVTADHAVGLAVKGIRDDAYSLTQEQVAAAMRRHGVNWTRASVAALEAGRHQVTVGELLALVAALDELTVGMGPSVELLLSGGTAEWWLQTKLKVEPTPGWALSADDVRLLARGKAMEVRERNPYRGQLLRRAVEAELEAAAKFDVDVEKLVAAARKKWKRTFVEERVARVAERVPEDAPARSCQAVRGHVTRG